MAKIEKKTKRYPSDLTDEEWARIEPFLPRASKAGRPVEVELREVLNAIRYMARSGGGWRMLPNDFPPWQTVYWWLARARFWRHVLIDGAHWASSMAYADHSNECGQNFHFRRAAQVDWLRSTESGHLSSPPDRRLRRSALRSRAY
jgi:transposase